MRELEDFLATHPIELTDWIEQFPWEAFKAEIIVTEESDPDVVIAQSVILEENAEVAKLIICRDALLHSGAEVQGTLVCYRAKIESDAECNYLITRSVEMETDAEVRSAIILDSLKMGIGAEIKELDMVDYTFLDIHQASVIHQKHTQSIDTFTSDVEQRLKLILKSAVDHLNQ